MCLNISASVALGCLFTPKVYLVLFQPYKNVRQPAGNGNQVSLHILGVRVVDFFVNLMKWTVDPILGTRRTRRSGIRYAFCSTEVTYDAFYDRQLEIVSQAFKKFEWGEHSPAQPECRGEFAELSINLFLFSLRLAEKKFVYKLSLFRYWLSGCLTLSEYKRGISR